MTGGSRCRVPQPKIRQNSKVQKNSERKDRGDRWIRDIPRKWPTESTYWDYCKLTKIREPVWV